MLASTLPDVNSTGASVFFIVVGLVLIWRGAARLRRGEKLWEPYGRRPAARWFGRTLPPLVELVVGTGAVASSIDLLVR